MVTANLRRQHDAAADLVADIRAATAAYSGEVDAFALSLKLAKLVGVLRIHFAQEDRYLYPLVMAAADPQTRATAQAFVSEMGSLGAAFNDFAARWNSSSAIANAFDRFRRESDAVFNALTTRIARENSILYPLADKVAGDDTSRAA